MFMLDYYTYTNRGGRGHNEDAVGADVYGSYGMFIVADGLGGHKKGELASGCVIETMLSGYDGSPEKDRASWLKALMAVTNGRILALQENKSCVMKSTAVALCIDDDTATWAHAGDSRLYYIHDSEISHITHDHSVAYKKYAAGEITRYQMNTDPDQSTLLRTLGSKDRYEAESFGPQKIVRNDAFMLCSDGAWEYLHDYDVLVDYLKAEDAKDWAEKLLLRI